MNDCNNTRWTLQVSVRNIVMDKVALEQISILTSVYQCHSTNGPYSYSSKNTLMQKIKRKTGNLGNKCTLHCLYSLQSLKQEFGKYLHREMVLVP